MWWNNIWFTLAWSFFQCGFLVAVAFQVVLFSFSSVIALSQTLLSRVAISVIMRFQRGALLAVQVYLSEYIAAWRWLSSYLLGTCVLLLLEFQHLGIILEWPWQPCGTSCYNDELTSSLSFTISVCLIRSSSAFSLCSNLISAFLSWTSLSFASISCRTT